MTSTLRRSVVVAVALAVAGVGCRAGVQAPAAQPAPAATGLTLEVARRAVDAAEREARANGWNVTIVLTDAAGVPVYLRRLDSASPRSFEIALNKARTSAATGLATGEYGQRVQAQAIQPVENGIPFPGGLPIRLGGQVVGAIGTSGVTAQQDEQISRAGLAAIGAG